jgi:hypothetical protein
VRPGCVVELRFVNDVLSDFQRQIPRCVREDLAQEAVVRTWAHPDVRCPSSFSRRVARNLAFDWLRQAQHDELREDCTQVSPVEPRHDALRLARCLGRAPARVRELVRRHYLDDEPWERLIDDEAGGPRDRVGERRWGQARDALYKRRRRGLSWLRQALEPARVSP